MGQAICRTMPTAADRLERDRADVCEAQELVFKLMRFSSFNDFDGSVVVDSLRDNRHLWRGAIFGRFGAYHSTVGGDCTVYTTYGCTLRDIQDDVYSADELLLTAPAGAEAALEALAKSPEWKADEVDWQQDQHAGKVLRVWWD